MAIDIGRSLTSAAVGLADEVMEWWDENEGRTESFKTAKDIGRLVIAGVGYGLQVFMPRQARLGETLALSATPLLVKSIAKPVRASFKKGAATEAAYTPRRRANAPVPAPAGTPVNASVHRSYAPEFADVILW